MEDIQIFTQCPWITDVCDVKEYFKEYNKILDEANGMKPHTEKFDPKLALREFFHMPDDLDDVTSRRNSPRQPLRTRSSSIETETPDSIPRGSSELQLHYTDDDDNDPFSVDRLEEDCSVDLLTVEGELPPRELCESVPIEDTGRITNWYAGAFMDGVIPDGGPEKLVTLAHQTQELFRRETVKDYVRLRHRLLKYSSTVRMIVKKDESPETVMLQDDLSGPCLRETIFNIRIHRPFHKRTFSKKASNRFPHHSQEILMLGSQKLSDLRDIILCINDYHTHTDMSENPNEEYLSTLPITKAIFPSAFFHFSGVFYSDFRNPDAKDLSENIRSWAKKYPKIGPMTCEPMDETKLSDLKLRLGYPYIYQHLGNCEHLIVITDIRLVHRTDISDPSRYPLCRGNPVKLSVMCYACGIFSAGWIVKDDSRLPVPYAHFCKKCLKSFCYDANGKKLAEFKLYPFIDEFAAQTAKDKKAEALPRSIEINFDGEESAQLIIKSLQ